MTDTPTGTPVITSSRAHQPAPPRRAPAEAPILTKDQARRAEALNIARSVLATGGLSGPAPLAATDLIKVARYILTGTETTR